MKLGQVVIPDTPTTLRPPFHTASLISGPSVPKLHGFPKLAQTPALPDMRLISPLCDPLSLSFHKFDIRKASVFSSQAVL